MWSGVFLDSIGDSYVLLISRHIILAWPIWSFKSCDGVRVPSSISMCGHQCLSTVVSVLIFYHLPLSNPQLQSQVPQCHATVLSYPDSALPWRQIHRSSAPLWKHNTSLWHLCRPSVRFDFGSINTHGVYMRWNKVGQPCPQPWLENMGHSGSHGWGLVFRPWYELILQGMADGWVIGRDNGLLFWVSVEHRNILYMQPSQSGNRGIPKEGNERGPIQLRAWQKVSGMDWQRAAKRAKGEGGRGVAEVGKQSGSCPQLKYLEVLRWSGELERRTSFMTSLVSSSFCSSLASQV